MPKIRDSKGDVYMFEVATKHTQRGPKLIQVPVTNPQSDNPPSRMPSPSKKRTWSPGPLDFTEPNDVESLQTPKCSQKIRKVFVNTH